jgi:hypothetical protein
MIRRGRNLLGMPLETMRELLIGVIRKVQISRVIQSGPFEVKPAHLIACSGSMKAG